MRTVVLHFAFLGCCCCSAASEADAPKEKSAADWSRYEILVKRNIFSKERGRAHSEENAGERKEKESPPPPKPEADLVLIGIIRKDGQLVAFVENTKTGTVQNVREGDEIARGKFGSMTLDKADYICDGASSEVTIGKTLDGGAATRSESVKAAVGSAPTTGDSGSSGANSVLERMRKKRQEALGK